MRCAAAKSTQLRPRVDCWVHDLRTRAASAPDERRTIGTTTLAKVDPDSPREIFLDDFVERPLDLASHAPQRLRITRAIGREPGKNWLSKSISKVYPMWDRQESRW